MIKVRTKESENLFSGRQTLKTDGGEFATLIAFLIIRQATSLVEDIVLISGSCC